MSEDENRIGYGARLAELAVERGDDVALSFVPEAAPDEELTFRQLDDRSTQIAHWLQGRGLAAGNRVAVAIRNSPEHVLVAFAAWKLGAAVIPMRWDLPAWELERVRAVIAPKVFVGEDDLDVIRATTDESTEPLPPVVSTHAWGICSSGSTGTPKVILNASPSVYDRRFPPTFLVESYGPVSHPQRVVVPAPLYHTNGFTAFSHLLAGNHVVLLSRFDAGRMLDAVGRYHATGFIATTIMLQRMARHEAVDATDFSSVEWVMHGAAMLPEWLARRWIELVGPEKFYVCYGSSEMIGATLGRGEEWLMRPGTVGRGAMGTTLRIIGQDGKALASGETGDIYMRPASSLSSEYLGDVPALRPTEDGFYTIGDVGWLDDDGFLFLADRRVDMIITGGANVFPSEVEAALSDHPGIADVVVIGLSDDEWGRRVHAIVQPATPDSPPSVDDIIAFAKGRLSSYKVPKTIEFVDKIGRSEAMKVNRSALVAEREKV